MTTPQCASRHRCGPVSVLSAWPEPVALPTKEAPRQEARSMDLTDLTSTDTKPASPAPPPGLVAGVDTHQDTHTLAVLTAQGAVIATSSFPADQQGYDDLTAHLDRLGPLMAVGVEGTSSYGAGLTRTLRQAGYDTVEVLRPSRRVRRHHGKSDPIDAIAAARTVLSGDGVSQAKDTTGPAEQLRLLLAARTRLISAATAITNSIHSLLTTAPEPLRERYRRLDTPALITRLARTRPTRTITTPQQAATSALHHMARTHQDLHHRAERLNQQMHHILTTHYPGLLAVYGAGTTVAAQLAVTAGGNPGRIHNEAAFAHLCATAPIPASSGKTTRHRLNPGGDRRANAALHRIALVRLRHDPTTKNYANRRTQEGKTTKEIIRCLKRAIAREVYRALTQPPPTDTTSTLAAHRKRHHLTQTDVAHALNTYPARISDIENHRRPLPQLTHRYHQYLTTLDTQQEHQVRRPAHRPAFFHHQMSKTTAPLRDQQCVSVGHEGLRQDASLSTRILPEAFTQPPKEVHLEAYSQHPSKVL